jgi:hypothetical protein
MQNVPLGLIKSRQFSRIELNESQLAVYYASYRHLAKMAARDSAPSSQGGLLSRLGTSSIISIGGWLMLKGIEHICKKRGLDLDKVKRIGSEAGDTFAKPVRVIS